jgi:MFS family permease
MSLQPTFGKLYTLFDIKRVFISALLIFEIGSVVCAAAPNSNAFITGRAVAGLGVVGIFCGGLTILGLAVERKKRPLFMGFIGGIYGISSVLGGTGNL